MSDWLTITEVGPNDRLIIAAEWLNQESGQKMMETLRGKRIALMSGQFHVFVLRGED